MYEKLLAHETGEVLEKLRDELAKKYHPDNPSGGDPDKFRQIHEAFQRSGV